MTSAPADEAIPTAFLVVSGNHFDLDSFLDRWPQWKGIASRFYRKGEPIPGDDGVWTGSGFEVDLVVGPGQVWEQLDLLRAFILQHHDALAWVRDYQEAFMRARLTMGGGVEPGVLELPAPVLGLLAGLGLKLEILPERPAHRPAG